MSFVCVSKNLLNLRIGEEEDDVLGLEGICFKSYHFINRPENGNLDRCILSTEVYRLQGLGVDYREDIADVEGRVDDVQWFQSTSIPYLTRCDE